MEPTADSRPPSQEFPRPGPIGLAIRAVLAVASIQAFVAILTKWDVFLESDPIESERYFTLATPWLLSSVFNLTFRRKWGAWPSIGFVVVGAVLGGVGFLVNEEFWNPAVTTWVFAALAVSFPVRSRPGAPDVSLGRFHGSSREGQAASTCRHGLAALWVSTTSIGGKPLGGEREGGTNEKHGSRIGADRSAMYELASDLRLARRRRVAASQPRQGHPRRSTSTRIPFRAAIAERPRPSR